MSEQNLAESFFGWEPRKFVDNVYQAADDYIADGLDALEASHLPSLPATQKSLFESSNDKFITVLRNTFETNIDKFELYALRNIFILNNEDNNLIEFVMKDIERDFINSQQQQQQQQQQGEDAPSSSTPGRHSAKKQKLNGGGSTPTPTSSTPSSTSNTITTITKDSIPSISAINSLDTQMKSLRKRLRLAKRRSSALKFASARVAKTLEKAELGETQIEEAVSGAGGELFERVSAVVMGKEGLESLKRESTGLVKDMGKSLQQENVNPKSLEEKYTSAKQLIQTRSAKDITNLTSILRR